MDLLFKSAGYPGRRRAALQRKPLGVSMQQIQEKLENHFQLHHLQTPEQSQNIIQHIYNLIKPNQSNITTSV